MRRRNALACLVLALSTPARAQSAYVGDLPFGAHANSGAPACSTLANSAGASGLDRGATAAEIVDNQGVIDPAPGASGNGDLDVGANEPGAEIVNQESWSATLANAGGAIDISGAAGSGRSFRAILDLERSALHPRVPGDPTTRVTLVANGSTPRAGGSQAAPG